LPFEAEQEVCAILLAHRDRPPPCFADFGVTDVPEAVEALVQRCLAKLPAERPPSARVLAEQYGEVLGAPIVDPDAFAPIAHCPVETEPEFTPETLIDQFEGFLPEAVAAMKLRGFVAGVGGEVVDSVPGLIRVRLPGRGAASRPKGFWSWLQPATPPPQGDIIELHMRQVAAPGRGVVAISVVRPAGRHEPPLQCEVNRERCRRVCQELRAYLMIGR
jgi:serine/threonine-protein kinase